MTPHSSLAPQERPAPPAPIVQPRFGAAPGEEAGIFDTLQTRIMTHWTEARAILDRKMPAPRTAIVYPTYVCNQDCLWCEYNAENTNRDLTRVMSKEHLFGLIDSLRDLGVRGVEFCGGGEPTL
ncbi:MAG: radical SAM protein, partial [Candidatus Hydrogenedentes bacterium]|nr:radical SAM protein [Candidatus Hydrogenedentota bacterium]